MARGARTPPQAINHHSQTCRPAFTPPQAMGCRGSPPARRRPFPGALLLASQLAAALALLTAISAAAQIPAILSDPAVIRRATLPDFSYAGYGFGLKPLPASPATVIDVTAHGAVPDDTGDDSKGVLAAIEAANAVAGPVTLRFPAGRFVLSEVLAITRSAIVVEGAGRGPGGTELHFPRPLRMIDRSDRLDELRRYLVRENKRQVEPKRNIDLPFSPYSWSGGVIWVQAPKSRPAVYLDDEREQEPAQFRLAGGEAFGTRVRLGQSGKFRPGDIVRIRWTSPDGPASALITSLYGAGMEGVGREEVGSRHFESPERAIVIQTTRVTAVNGDRLTLADPLLHAIGAKLPATLVRWQGLTDVGIRDLAISFPAGTSFGHHLEEGYNAIAINDLFDGFVASVRVSESDSAVLSYNSASLTIRDILTEGGRTAHYAVHMGNVHNVLATGLEIRNKVLHSLSFNTQSTRSVFQHASVWKDSVLDQHAGANHQNLFDAIRLHVVARRRDGTASYPLWDGSGAAYWQPGHGRLNTHWNLHVIVDSGALPGETVLLTGLEEGPDARIVGVWGNRPFAIDYRPEPYVEALNQPMTAVPSLYDWQLSRRRR